VELLRLAWSYWRRCQVTHGHPVLCSVMAGLDRSSAGFNLYRMKGISGMVPRTLGSDCAQRGGAV
jgi:hypothetical protein